MSERTYLELSEDASHKFYEVAVEGTRLTIRYGRIGDNGQTQIKDFATSGAAHAEAAKKIAEKVRKGYAAAVKGEREKRASAPRETAPEPAPPEPATPEPVSGTNPALASWRFSGGNRPAFGLFVDEARAWLCDEAGSVRSLDLEGRLLDEFRLPAGVKCIAANDDWLYLGCDDGNLYDLRTRTPRVAFRVGESPIHALDLRGSVLVATDARGNVLLVNHEDESRWQKRGRGHSGRMVRCDGRSVHHGHSAGVTSYDLTGRELWHRETRGEVLFGCQAAGMVYVSTSTGVLHRFSDQGTGDTLFSCDAPVLSCAADGRYVFASDDRASLYGFDQEGHRLWKLATGCGSARSMQLSGDRLYLATTEGVLACIDASGPAIQSPQPTALQVSEPVETTIEADDGVVVECFQDGSQVRVRALSEGFDRTWNVQFPRDLREVGARFVVQELREATNGGFYRAHGAIRRLHR